jgi:hypothetical protein
MDDMSNIYRTSSKICKGVPSFCTVYVVSKDESSLVYVPGSKIDVTSGSGVPKGNSSSSNTEVFSEDSSLVSGNMLQAVTERVSKILLFYIVYAFSLFYFVYSSCFH